MENPISPKARSWVYIFGVIFSAVIAVAVVTLEVLELSQYAPILAAASAAVTTVVAVLARANLTIVEPTSYVARHSEEYVEELDEAQG